ncbi:MAG: pyruvate dehydrogenase complex E1 component subunit beta [Deltaproteobacteria bacterium]|nr:pyruvate dehydrogenase complex E1 component subunit beta [Deltaproteobacteria bacterium]
MPVVEYREALRQAMEEEMLRDPDVFLMGEEVGFYNGAYKVSKGMLEKFGDKRIIDSPITECGFAGLGIGAAMVGMRPIIEFMTWNFSLVAIDQIVNHAAKIRQMSGGQFNCPITFRGPGGAAHQLAAQHSSAFESYYAHIPGLKVVMPANPKDAKGLLKSSIRDENPVCFIEGETMYSDKGEIPDGEYTIPLGVGEIKREGTDCTIIGWSKMVNIGLAAAEILATQGINAEVLDPRTIRPLDEDLIVASVKKTGRCVILEEGYPFAGVGAEIAYRISQRCFDDLDHPVARLTSMDVSAPYHRQVENSIRPTPEKAADLVKKVLYLG